MGAENVRLYQVYVFVLEEILSTGFPMDVAAFYWKSYMLGPMEADTEKK